MDQTGLAHTPTGHLLLRYAMATILAITIAGHAMTADADEIAGMNRTCRLLYKEWRKVAPHKAFAVSQIIGDMQACGYSFAWENQKKAINSAIGYCKSSVAYRNMKGATCRLVKVL